MQRYGTRQADTLLGGDGQDTLLGREGDDVLIGLGGADMLSGGLGSDTASYAGATTGLLASLTRPAQNTGEAAGDRYASIENLQGGLGADTLIGSAIGNRLEGGAGADVLSGLAGDDTLSGADAPGATAADRLEGGDGQDWASWRGADQGVIASLNPLIVNAGAALGDTLVAIEHLEGTDHADLLVGDAGRNHLRGHGSGLGVDTLIGGAGADTLEGGEGLDVASYQLADAGVTALLADPEGDRSSLRGEANGDVYIGIEGLVGSAHNDILGGDKFANLILGGAGNDRIVAGHGIGIAGGGFDTLDGGEGSDIASYSAAAEGVLVQLTPDVESGAGDLLLNIEGIIGSDFADILIGNGDANELYGREGDDELLGDDASGAGNDRLYGEAGDDVLIGGGGDDRLRGGLGADILDGGEGFDVIEYGISTAGVHIDLFLGTASGGEAEGDQFFGIEAVSGSSHGDTLIGGDGADSLYGDRGNDFFRGGLGLDTLYGDEGDDTYDLTDDLQHDVIEQEGEGIDTIIVNYDYALRDGLARQIENLSSSGTRLTGNSLDNRLVTLADQQETLSGAAGNDTLIGGRLGDVLTGGAGADHFVYLRIEDSPDASRDRITDFERGLDRIDLSAIDAGTASGDQAFLWRGTSGFVGGGQGSVRVSVSSGTTLVSIDIGDGGAAEMRITLSGIHPLGASDFIL